MRTLIAAIVSIGVGLRNHVKVRKRPLWELVDMAHPVAHVTVPTVTASTRTAKEVASGALRTHPVTVHGSNPSAAPLFVTTDSLERLTGGLQYQPPAGDPPGRPSGSSPHFSASART